MKFDNRRRTFCKSHRFGRGERFQMAGRRCRTTFCGGCGISRWKEAWGPLWSEGYKFQFEGDLKCTHEKAKLVGRAVTSVMVPICALT